MSDRQYVSRGGLKLEAALDHFKLDVAGFICADLGCSVGGFTDCLLHRGVAKVFAVDTAYGELAWTIRNDQRVVVMERTNALHVDPPEPCDLVVIDLGWTKQDKAIPAAGRWVKPGGRIVTLIKPHYESGYHRLDDEQAEQVAQQVVANLLSIPGVGVVGSIKSPIPGGKGGNAEWLAMLTVLSSTAEQ